MTSSDFLSVSGTLTPAYLRLCLGQEFPGSWNLSQRTKEVSEHKKQKGKEFYCKAKQMYSLDMRWENSGYLR